MAFNNDKFVSLHYSPRQATSRNKYYTSNNLEIEEKREVKDLGILMNTDLTFRNQIQKSVMKARSKMGWATRTFKSRTRETMMTLYKSLILPHIEYCSVLISPFKLTEIALLESVQRSFTARITEMKEYNY